MFVFQGAVRLWKVKVLQILATRRVAGFAGSLVRRPTSISTCLLQVDVGPSVASCVLHACWMRSGTALDYHPELVSKLRAYFQECHFSFSAVFDSSANPYQNLMICWCVLVSRPLTPTARFEQCLQPLVLLGVSGERKHVHQNLPNRQIPTMIGHK